MKEMSEEDDFESESEEDLASCDDDLSEGDASASSEMWRTEGSVYLGRRVRRSVPDEDGERWADGEIIGWLSAEESDFVDARGRPAALYRAEYDGGLLKGECEDLEEAEVLESLTSKEAELPDLDDTGRVVVESTKSEYELLRESNIQRNRDLMLSLGLEKQKKSAPERKKRTTPLQTTVEKRKSPRLAEAANQLSQKKQRIQESLRQNSPHSVEDEEEDEDEDEDDDDEVGLADELETLAKKSNYPTTTSTRPTPNALMSGNNQNVTNKVAGNLIPPPAAPSMEFGGLKDDVFVGAWSTSAPSTTDILGFIDAYDKGRRRATVN